MMAIVVVGPSRLSETFCVAKLGTPELSLIGVENPAKQNLVRGRGEADLGLGLRLEFYGLSDWNASEKFFDYPHQSEAKSKIRNDQTSQWLAWSKRLDLVVDVWYSLGHR